MHTVFNYSDPQHPNESVTLLIVYIYIEGSYNLSVFFFQQVLVEKQQISLLYIQLLSLCHAMKTHHYHVIVISYIFKNIKKILSVFSLTKQQQQKPYTICVDVV